MAEFDVSTRHTNSKMSWTGGENLELSTCTLAFIFLLPLLSSLSLYFALYTAAFYSASTVF